MKQYCDKRWQCRSDKLWHNDISRYNSFRKWNIWFSKYDSGNETYDFWIYPKQTQGSSRSQFIFNFQLKTNKERNKLTKEQTAKEKKHGAKYFPKLKLFQKFSQYIFISRIIPVWNCALAISWYTNPLRSKM